MTFIDDVLSERAVLDDIDSYVAAWHDAEEDLGELHTYLGLLWPECVMRAEEHDVLGYVIEARCNMGVHPGSAHRGRAVARCGANRQWCAGQTRGRP